LLAACTLFWAGFEGLPARPIVYLFAIMFLSKAMSFVNFALKVVAPAGDCLQVFICEPAPFLPDATLKRSQLFSMRFRSIRLPSHLEPKLGCADWVPVRANGFTADVA
jgi:hypothetical protein